MVLLIISTIFTLHSICVRAFDPCAVGNHQEFPTYGFGARKHNCSQDLLASCDYYLDKQWYTSSLGSLLNACPTVASCGAAFPAWIDGQLPGVADGIVNRTVCIKRGTRCCAESNLTAQIKNCNGFFAYNLPPLNECSSAYCLASDLPCKSSTTGLTVTSPTTGVSKTLLTGVYVGAGVVIYMIGAAIVFYIRLKCKESKIAVCNTGSEKTDHLTSSDYDIYTTVDIPSPYTTIK
ncbi:oncoprotein-induced transcript 3 protein-like [Mya arenaria]|uniref:oncoprotein-induced transcript 3 protein-like n=1 Tax=Mya arenaria TaxID=6604 RepID=UPI0022E3AAF5|nr:oncoprotein-induced transcript 3 protein-like [Mya arenaria]